MGIRRIAMALSGGVDSAVSGLILKQKGYDVTAVYMQNWSEVDEHGQCNAEKEFRDAQKAADIIGVPLKKLNFEKEFWNQVFSSTLDSYTDGTTPNPDILCNKHVKFGALFDHVTGVLGFDWLATGHYARIKYSYKHAPMLMRAKDRAKDQTYFLSQIEPSRLDRCMFPVGSLTKGQVKEVATYFGLDYFAQKKESYGICFIGKRNFPDFIHEYVNDTPGDIKDVDSGRVLGRHPGIHLYTVGQCAKLGGQSQKYFVCELDPTSHTIYVAPSGHTALSQSIVSISAPHWLSEVHQRTLDKDGYLVCQTRLRYRAPAQQCTIFNDQSQLRVEIDEPIRSVVAAPGQYAVFYDDDQCIGSSVILKQAPEKSKTPVRVISSAVT